MSLDVAIVKRRGAFPQKSEFRDHAILGQQHGEHGKTRQIEGPQELGFFTLHQR